MNLEQFVRGYIDAALWSSVAPNGKHEGEPLDSLDVTVSKELMKQANADCANFIKDNLADLELYAEQYSSNPEYAGHDFWLTRCGHGAGFWDRKLAKDLGERLSEAAYAFGEVDLYVNRKKVYAS